MPSSKKTRVRGALAALLMSTALVGGGYAIGHADTPPTTAPITAPNQATQPGFANLVDRVKHAVVNVSTTEKVERSSDGSGEMPQFPPGSPFAELFRQFQQQQQAPQHALGSGFLIDPAGYIVTNNHVAGKASKITVTLDDGTTYPATLKGHDEKTDLALLKIDAGKPLPYVEFGDSDQARVGDWVIAVGNPFGLGGTVTAGILSAHGRNINSGPYDDFLQVDAPINPGNSGGPLFDQTGHVLGIDTAIFSPNGGNIGIGFAIPANQAKTVVAQLKDHGSVARGWLGVQMQPLTPALAKAIGRNDANGVLIDEVQPNSPAEKAELKQGDVITAYDKKPIKLPRDLAVAVADTPAGKSVPVTVWRDGHERTVNVAIQKQQESQTASANGDQADGPRVGMALAPLSPEARDALNLDATTKGVVVSRVTPGSPAAESGIRAGDVIVSVANASVTTPDQAASKIHDAQQAKKEAVPLLVMRDGAKYYLALQLANG
ncbi:MAG: DegQ family serine endoprotease [Gemmatimonas sp.]